MAAQKTANKWGGTVRQVQILYKGNRIEGVTRMSEKWVISENVDKSMNDKRKGQKDRAEVDYDANN